MLSFRVYTKEKNIKHSPPMERWDGGSWFTEVFDNPPRREVYRVIERVFHKETGGIVEVLSKLPPDWAETPVWKDSQTVDQTYYVAEAQALPQALQQFSLEIWQKYMTDNSSELQETACQIPSQKPSQLEKTQSQQQLTPRASSSKRRPEIQVGLLSLPKSSLVRHSRTKPNPSVSNEKRDKKGRR